MAVETNSPRATTIAVLAMGGEGGGVLSDWIVDVAEHSGYLAQTTSVPGVAQRTGATIYYIEIFPEEAARKAGKPPVLALMPVPGEVDVVIASELMEAGRAVQRGLVTPSRTTFIASTNRVYSMTERTAMGDGRVDDQVLIDSSRKAARVFVGRDFARLAQDARSVLSASLFGALAGTGALPFNRGDFEEAIRRGGVGVESSLAAFAAGFTSASGVEPERAPVASAAPAFAAPRWGPRVAPLIERVRTTFPTASHEVLLNAVPRVADYQDVRYAALYLDRLATIHEIDARHGAGDSRLLIEAARELALWMTYEDAIRVADLKIRRSRFDRVRGDARMKAGDILRINDFVHPRFDEIADITPAPLARLLARSRFARSLIDRLAGHGRIVTTSSLSGFLQLYLVASLRPLRPRSLRFQRERGLIDGWLAELAALAPADYELAVAVASLPRLIKGYGDTHARGWDNFERIRAVIPTLRSRGSEGAAMLGKLASAALADDTGDKLSAALAALAAPAP